MTHWFSWRGAVVGILVLGVLLLPSGSSLLAHGGGTSQLANAEAGPYRVFAWTTPEPWRAGEVHVTISVTLPPPAGTVIDDNQLSNMLDEPVSDAVVTVSLIPVDGTSAPIGISAVRQDLLGGAYYEADTELPVSGNWQVFVDVGGPLGEGRVDFMVTVLPAQRVSWLWLGLGAGALIGILGLIGMRRSTTEQAGHARARTVKGL